MAKWSGIYLYDCHTMLKKIEKELEKVVDRSEPPMDMRMKKWSTESTALRSDYKTKLNNGERRCSMSEEQEPIDVVQVMYNALTNLEKTARVGCYGKDPT